MLQRIWLVEDKVISHLGFQLTKTKRPIFTLKKCDTAIFLVKICKPGRNSWVHIFWKYSILQTCVLQSWGCLSFFNTLNANTFLKCSNNNINNKGTSEKEPDMEPPDRHRFQSSQWHRKCVCMYLKCTVNPNPIFLFGIKNGIEWTPGLRGIRSAPNA